MIRAEPRGRRPRKVAGNLWPYWPATVYRSLAALALILAITFTILTPHDQRRLYMPDPWAYEVATRRFAQGQWVLTDEQVAVARADVRLRGGSLEQYVPAGDGQWVFRQSPGYPLLLVPFYRLGMPRLANLLLAVVATLVLYKLLGRWYDEQLAAVGVLLLFWSPISLVSLHYVFMATFASGMLLLISGGLLLWYVKQEQDLPWTWIGLFVAGLAGGWSVLVRNVNVLPLTVLGGYFLFHLWQTYRNTKQLPWQKLAAFSAGVSVALLALLIYNTLAFGSLLNTGYAYPSPDDPLYLWKGNPVTEVPGGTKTWLAEGTIGAILRTVVEHLTLWSRPALFGWPFLPLLLIAVFQTFRQRRVTQITGFLLLWCLAVYSFYAGVVFFGITRILSVPNNQTWGFFTGVRYLFPATLPFILLLFGWLHRWPRRWLLAFALAYMIVGGWIFWRAVTI